MIWNIGHWINNFSFVPPCRCEHQGPIELLGLLYVHHSMKSLENASWFHSRLPSALMGQKEGLLINPSICLLFTILQITHLDFSDFTLNFFHFIQMYTGTLLYGRTKNLGCLFMIEGGWFTPNLLINFTSLTLREIQLLKFYDSKWHKGFFCFKKDVSLCHWPLKIWWQYIQFKDWITSGYHIGHAIQILSSEYNKLLKNIENKIVHILQLLPTHTHIKSVLNTHTYILWRIHSRSILLYSFGHIAYTFGKYFNAIDAPEFWNNNYTP